ncbi:competence protein ComGF [Streptococcus pneumoniae]|nr:competence protein ComGF [Streptococcus pneumoniae]
MVQNSCWQSKSHKVKAFTLLESLLALIVISGGFPPFSSYESAPHFRSSLPATKRAKGVALVCGPT